MKLFMSLVMVLLVGAGCALDSTIPSVLGYSVDDDVRVEYGGTAVESVFVSDATEDASTCETLVGKFPQAWTTNYEFVLDTYDSGWRVYVLPNMSGYTSIEEVRADYEACGIIMWYPQEVNEKYILVTQNCEGESTCMEARARVEDTLELN